MAAQLRSLAETDVRNPIPPEQLLPALQTPPFIYVPGTFNTRDIGLLTSGPTPPRIRPGYIYRSGGLEMLRGSPESQAMLRDKLRVRRIFDLRSRDEHARSSDPEIEGVESVWLAGQGTTEERAQVDLGSFVEGNGEEGFVGMYMEVLRHYGGMIAEVLRSVRDRPEDPILFHCTAGRDRTGVVAGMLETLAGYDAEAVADDFVLSRIGTEPARELLVGFAKKGAGVDGEEAYDAPGFYNLVSLKAVCWNAFVDAVKKDYGGFEGYVNKVLGFSEGDLIKIRKNLAEAP